MPVPSLAVSPTSPLDIDADVLVIGIEPTPEGGVRAVGAIGEALEEWAAGLSSVGLSASAEETSRHVAPAGVRASSVVSVGLGRGERTSDALRLAAGAAARASGSAQRVALTLPIDSDADAQAVLEGAALGAYRYSGRAGSGTGVTEVVVLSSVIADEVLDRARASSEAVALVRDLVTTPPNLLGPADLAARARSAAEGLPIAVEELTETELREGGFGGILGVGQGSARPPRLVVLRYDGGGERHVALAGKGITFDSGGLSLKPAGSMVGMKYDMTGAATALAATIAIAKLGMPVRVTTWLPIAENLPSGTALRPNDVLTIRGGTTVEVLNTDAEGRLVLADALAAASEERPDVIVDVATLTGAARVALGERYTGLMGDDDIVERVRAAAASTGELVWPMPLPGELRPLLATDVADIANAKPGNTAAGMLLAAVFLREFVGRRSDDEDAPRIPWAHLDIAGPANNSGSPFGYTPKGVSGVMVRTLIALAEGFATE